MSPAMILALAFTVSWLPLFFVRTESVGDAFPQYRPDERATSVLTRIALTLHMSLGCLLTSVTSPMPPLRTVAGMLLFFGGVAFWVWGRTAIGPWRTRPLPDAPPLRFRRDGPFRLVRHPLYFGLLLSSAALVIVTGQALLLLSFAASVAALAARSRQEEARLHAQLGPEYDDYSRRVKRLIPFVW